MERIMFADPANPSSLGPALLTSIGAVIVAGIAGVFAWLSNSKSNRNAADIQEYKSATDRDLERLKAKLEHGQLISTTQWNAEFNAYQALWKAFVPVRTIARKIVKREGELTDIGLVVGDVSEELKIENIKKLLQQYAAKSSECVAAINEHAPFYAADIRKKANEAHALAHEIFQSTLAMVVARQKGQSIQTETEEKREKELDDLMLGTDALEEIIRKRMSDVRVFNPAVV
jgi:hypothetical protein